MKEFLPNRQSEMRGTIAMTERGLSSEVLVRKLSETVTVAIFGNSIVSMLTQSIYR